MPKTIVQTIFGLAPPSGQNSRNVISDQYTIKNSVQPNQFDSKYAKDYKLVGTSILKWFGTYSLRNDDVITSGLHKKL